MADADTTPLPTLTAEAPAVEAPPQDAPETPSQAIARRPEVLPPGPPATFEMQLEPRTMGDAKRLALDMFNSHVFSAYGTPHAVLAIIMAGRELGMQAIRSLRAFHMIDGKPTLPADLIRALVLQSGKAKYFRCTERTPEKATFETLRVGEGEKPLELSFTLADAKLAWPNKDDNDKSFLKSGWGRHPADMLVARASSKLARLVYSDVIHGLYATEEIRDEATA